MTRPVEIPQLSPRGLSCSAAAYYIGLGATKFTEMVNDGRMPKPKIVDARKIWDKRDIDKYFDALPDGSEASGWEDVN